MPADIVFRVDLPHGRCVGVRVPGANERVEVPDLASQEIDFLGSLGPARRPTWIAGRIAMHAALLDLGLASGPILATQRGAPELPAGMTGSISSSSNFPLKLSLRFCGDSFASRRPLSMNPTSVQRSASSM